MKQLFIQRFINYLTQKIYHLYWDVKKFLIREKNGEQKRGIKGKGKREAVEIWKNLGEIKGKIVTHKI